MKTNIFDDRKNTSATVRIICDNPVMDSLIERVLSPFCKRTERSAVLTVICTQKDPPLIDGACIYIGTSPEKIMQDQRFLERPLDIRAFAELCRKLISENTVHSSLGWSADTLKETAVFNDREVSLSPKEMKLYLLLLENEGKCVPREIISRALWDGGEPSNSTDVYICFLRKKLESISDSGVLISVRKKGYMLKKP